MNEPEVIQQVHRFFKGHTEDQYCVPVFTDAHHTLTGIQSLRPFQRITLDLGDRRIFPDLVGQLKDGETTLAIEAKGVVGLTKGIAQAQHYQERFHLSALAAGSSGSSTKRLFLIGEGQRG